MAFRPLVLDPARGVPAVLGEGSVLEVGGTNGSVGGFRHTNGFLGFYGRIGLQHVPQLHGNDFDVLTQLIDSLVELGLFEDHRRANWADRFGSFAQLGDVSPFPAGRLIVGSAGGWTALDLPADLPNELQVPARGHGVLAYTSVVTVGPTAPRRPLPGSIWIDPTATTGARLYVLGTNNVWIDVLGGALGQLQGLGNPGDGDLFIGARGTSGGGQWSQLKAGAFGEALTIDALGKPAWAAPALSGPVAPPGPHPIGRLWADTAQGSEALAIWDGAQWLSVPVGSSALSSLAALQPSLLDGDLLSWSGGRLQRIPLGAAGQKLTSRGGAPAWEADLAVSAAAPTGNEQLWFDPASHSLRVRDGSEWKSASGQSWTDVNASGARLEPGTAVLLQGGWKLANGAIGGLKRFAGLVLAGADAGNPTAVAYAGVVTLQAAQWAAVIDPADQIGQTGLQPGNDYWLSTTRPGMITRDRRSGVLIGQALTAGSLFIFPRADWGNGASGVGSWFLSALDDCLATALQEGDVLGWGPMGSIDRARWINGDRTPIVIRHSADVVSAATGAITTPNAPGSIGIAPTDTNLVGGTSYLRDGELFVGTAPQDPALFWKLADGTTHKLSGGAGAGSGKSKFDLRAVDLASDPDASQIQLVDGTGGRHEVILRGAHGIEVTTTNRGTLVISGEALWMANRPGVDGGRFSPKPARAPNVASTPYSLDAGRFTLPEVIPPDPLDVLDAGNFTTGTP